MTKKNRKPNLIGLIVIGCGLVAVGISTDNVGLLGAGVLFIIIGAASAVKTKRERDTDDSGDEQQQD
jgi:membrane-bound ClpP family serine protease